MKNRIIIRNYLDSDFEAAAKLFYETVHFVNAKDYSEEQLNAWSESPNALNGKRRTLAEQRTILATINGEIAGFASMDGNYLDMLYVSKDFLRQGVATAMCDELEKERDIVTTHASITAKPFFEKRGYEVLQKRTVERHGVKMTNFAMQKNCGRKN